MRNIKYLKYKNRYIMLSFVLLLRQSNVNYECYNKLCYLMTLADTIKSKTAANASTMQDIAIQNPTFINKENHQIASKIAFDSFIIASMMRNVITHLSMNCDTSISQ